MKQNSQNYVEIYLENCKTTKKWSKEKKFVKSHKNKEKLQNYVKENFRNI